MDNIVLDTPGFREGYSELFGNKTRTRGRVQGIRDESLLSNKNMEKIVPENIPKVGVTVPLDRCWSRL